jgi:peptide deformylase
MIREFLPTDSPILRRVAQQVIDFSTDALSELVLDMFETMRAGRGVGLAAPQIGVSKRIIVFEFHQSERAPGEPAIPATVLINPVITAASGSADGKEGCFSVPGYMGIVTRREQIAYVAQDLRGSKIEGTASAFHARIIQHEIDHLDGVLYTDRASEVFEYHREGES